MSLEIDHGSGHLRGILHSVQSVFIQDIDVVPAVDQDSGRSAVADVHGDDQGVVVQK